MTAERFSLDANILIYALDVDAGSRHTLAASIVDRAIDADCRLAVQALSEFFVAVTRKRLVPPELAATQVEEWLRLFPIIAPTSQSGSVGAGLCQGRPRVILGRPAPGDSGGRRMQHDRIGGHGARARTFGTMTVRHPFAGEHLSPFVERLLAP